MITKQNLENIILKQRKSLEDLPPGYPRRLADSIPYLTDRMLLIGGMRGCGCTTFLQRMLRFDHPEAWYVDFEDPRMAGFDTQDFTKLDRLMEDSGKGVALFNRMDLVEGWKTFCTKKMEQGIKMVSTVSLEVLMCPEQKHTSEGMKNSSCLFTTLRLDGLSYSEFLDVTRRRAGEQSVNDYMLRGGFPGLVKNGSMEAVHLLYREILTQDVLLSAGIRDQKILQRIALTLITSSGDPVTANKLRDRLKIKAVSTVTEHMAALERAGLIRLVSILSDNPARQAVNPRQVYVADTALIAALTPDAEISHRLFKTMIFNHLFTRNSTIYYTLEEGGCDFVVTNRQGEVRCVQACPEEDPDRMQIQTEGLLWALRKTGSRKGVMVTRNQSDRISMDGYQIEITDADAFLSED